MPRQRKKKEEPKAKPSRGRPSSYETAFAEQAKKLCALGATDAELADFFEVSIRTIANWQAQHEEFLQALKGGKEKADDRVEKSLYHRAVGYSHDAVKIFMPANAPSPVYAKYREHVPPDTTACIFWLKNRRPELWRDKSDVAVENVNYAITDRAPTEDEWIAKHVTTH